MGNALANRATRERTVISHAKRITTESTVWRLVNVCMAAAVIISPANVTAQRDGWAHFVNHLVLKAPMVRSVPTAANARTVVHAMGPPENATAHRDGG